MCVKSFCFSLILLIFLIGNCRPDDSVNTQSFETVINDVANLKIGTNKLVLYLTIRNLLNNSEPNEKEVKSQQALEEKVSSELQDLFLQSFTGERNSEASRTLKGFQWELIAEVDLYQLEKDDVLFAQKIVNQTLSDNYQKVDISSLIDRVNELNTTSERSRIAKLLTYGGLHHAIHTAQKDEQQNASKLADSIKNLTESFSHESSKEYFLSYLQRLTAPKESSAAN